MNTTLESFTSRSLDGDNPIALCRVLHVIVKSLDEPAIEKALRLIDDLVIQDDAYICSFDGLQCAFKQAQLYSEIGQAFRAFCNATSSLVRAAHRSASP